MTGIGDWAALPFFAENLPAIDEKLAQEITPIFPPKSRRFRALELCQPQDVRVVILGQDPYHTPGKADGLAFSIPQDFPGRLDSLGNIFKEIESDLGRARSRTDLSDWAEQGALLLNTALSVPQAKAGGHKSLGWSVLVQQIFQMLDPEPRAFFFWGKPAQRYKQHLKRDHHLMIETAHPSPLSAHRGFFGSRPFSLANQWLKERGHSPIDWGDPER